MIAEREFTLDPDQKVTIRLGMPFTPETEGFPNESWCPHQITGLGNGKVRRAVGIDAFQSLRIALQVIGSDLYASEEYKAGRLHLGGRDPDLNLPVFDELRHLVPPIPPQPFSQDPPSV